jgi:hypothetical protein
MKNKKKGSGIAILIGGKFNKKIIREDPIFLANFVYIIRSVKPNKKFDWLSPVTGDDFNNLDTIKLKEHRYKKTQQVDKFGRVIYEYTNKRKTTSNGVLPEFKNNKEVCLLQNRFDRIKQDLSKDMLHQHVKDILLLEYNDILQKLLKFNR